MNWLWKSLTTAEENYWILAVGMALRPAFAIIGYHVSGFDISENNIRIANRIAEKYGFGEKTSFSVQASENLKYSSEQFDIIVGIDILHHIEKFDRIRNTRIVTTFFSKGKSFDKHITDDEIKLTPDDINDIKDVFPDLSMKRYLLFSRLNRFLRKAGDKRPSALEKLDHFIFEHIPFLRIFGGEVVLILRK